MEKIKLPKLTQFDITFTQQSDGRWFGIIHGILGEDGDSIECCFKTLEESAINIIGQLKENNLLT